MIQKSQFCDADLRLVRQAIGRIQSDKRLPRLLCEERLGSGPACQLGEPDGLQVPTAAGHPETIPQLEIHQLELDSLLPERSVEPAVKKTDWYRKLADSIEAVGQIQPITLLSQSGHNEPFVILDGRLRREALFDLGLERADCWIIRDRDVSVNSHRHRRLTPVRENLMIRKAHERGLSRTELSEAIGYSPTAISRKLHLLRDIAGDAQQLMIVDRMTQAVIQQLRWVQAARQTRMVELIVATDDYSTGYAKCLVGATPQKLLVDCDTPKRIDGLSPTQIANLESEREPFESDYLQAVATYGVNSLQLTVLMGYARVLFGNSRIRKELALGHTDITAALEKLFSAYGPPRSPN